MDMPETTISELFARDPLQLKTQDITSIVEKLRSQRSRFNAGDTRAGKPASRKTAAEKKAAAAVAITGKLDLGDL